MSDKIIMLCIVLAAVSVMAHPVYPAVAISYRRRVKMKQSEKGIPPEEISIGVTGDDKPLETGNYYRNYFFHLADSSTETPKMCLSNPSTTPA